MKYSIIAIIYNPRSTGNSRSAAQQLQRQLSPVMKGTPIKRLPTRYAGHAEELAYEIATKYKRPLIVSSSGDGGYHEVINGAMRAQDEGHAPICAVLPTGNANDHARSLHSAEPADLIIKGKTTKLDLLKISTEYRGTQSVRYAHSYVGFGMTPEIAVELNSHTLNRYNEIWMVTKSLLKLKPVQLLVDGKNFEIDSLICSSVPKMAKYLTVSKNAKPNDGLFEVIMFHHGHKLRLVLHLFKGAFTQLGATKQAREIEIKAVSTTPMQMDGEVRVCKKGSRVVVLSQKQKLLTLI